MNPWHYLIDNAKDMGYDVIWDSRAHGGPVPCFTNDRVFIDVSEQSIQVFPRGFGVERTAFVLRAHDIVTVDRLVIDTMKEYAVSPQLSAPPCDGKITVIQQSHRECSRRCPFRKA